MTRLLKAEFRKILTTKMWWALLIGAFVLAMLWSTIFSLVVHSILKGISDNPTMREFNIGLDKISFGSVFLTRAINIASIFPMIFGGLALASEIGRKTLSTSFLTAPNRTLLLSAKAITYVVWGAIFAVVIMLAATLGILIGNHGDLAVSFGAWAAILGSGILSCILWTLLGVGVGALLGSPIGTTVALLVYALIIGPLLDLGGLLMARPSVLGFDFAAALPNGSADGLTGATAATVMKAEVQDALGGSVLPSDLVHAIDTVGRAAAGASGSFGLVWSAVIFLAWSAAFFGLGIWRTQTRDVT